MMTLLKGLTASTILVVSSPRCHGGLWFSLLMREDREKKEEGFFFFIIISSAHTEQDASTGSLGSFMV